MKLQKKGMIVGLIIKRLWTWRTDEQVMIVQETDKQMLCVKCTRSTDTQLVASVCCLWNKLKIRMLKKHFD